MGPDRRQSFTGVRVENVSKSEPGLGPGRSKTPGSVDEAGAVALVGAGARAGAGARVPNFSSFRIKNNPQFKYCKLDIR